MNKFKVGDRVIFYKTDGEYNDIYTEYLGRLGTVLGVGTEVIKVHFDEDAGYMLPYMKNVRLASSPCPMEVPHVPCNLD